MIPPPPTSTLFPYTTLFRSVVWKHALKNAAIPIVTIVGIELGTLLDADDGHNRDRKSTRLNSSHVAISYAVFCLKKKINPDFAALGSAYGALGLQVTRGAEF